jgi:hypothetical protein
VHQDHAGWGDAVADSGFYRDVKLVKDAGFDFIRGSHYPHARRLRMRATGWAFCFGRKIVSGAWAAGLQELLGHAAPIRPSRRTAGFEQSVKTACAT